MMRKFISMDFFQNLGKAFMLPVALLSALGMLLGIGSAGTFTVLEILVSM